MKIPRILGTILKGAVTIVGGVLGVGGIGAAVASGDQQLATCVTYVLSQPAGAVTILGAVLLLFGFGRKAGWLGATGVTGPLKQ